MPTLGFWNIGRVSIDVAIELVVRYGIDIIVFAEQHFPEATFINAFNKATGRPLYCPQMHPTLPRIISRVRIYSIFPTESFRAVSDSHYTSILEYNPSVGKSFLIAAVHLPSKLHQDTIDQYAFASRTRRLVDAAESTVGHMRTVVLGDFNMNPFEAGMVCCDALHGVMDRRVASKGTRTVMHSNNPYFYNPMWSIMGNSKNLALGTYYLESGNTVHYFWDTFDQVLIRPDLLQHFKDDDLSLLDKIGNTSLLHDSKSGLNVSIADHLPIIFKLKTEL